MERKVYIVTDCDNDFSKAVALTEEQAKAINWLINMADLDYTCEEPTIDSVEAIE